MQQSIRAESNSNRRRLLLIRLTGRTVAAWATSTTCTTIALPALTLTGAIPRGVRKITRTIDGMGFRVFDVADWLRQAETGLVTHIDQHVVNRLRQVHSRPVAYRVRFQSGWSTQRDVWWAGKSNRRSGDWHAPGWHVSTRNRCSGISRTGNHQGSWDAWPTDVSCGADWHGGNDFSPIAINLIGNLVDIAAICRGLR